MPRTRTHTFRTWSSGSRLILVLMAVATTLACRTVRTYEIDTRGADEFVWDGRVKLTEETVTLPFGDPAVSIIGIELPGTQARDVMIRWQRGQPGKVRATVEPRAENLQQVLGYRVRPVRDPMTQRDETDAARLAELSAKVRSGEYGSVDGFELARFAQSAGKVRETLYKLDEEHWLRVRATDSGDGIATIETAGGRVLYQYGVAELPVRSPPH